MVPSLKLAMKQYTKFEHNVANTRRDTTKYKHTDIYTHKQIFLANKMTPIQLLTVQCTSTEILLFRLIPLLRLGRLV